MMKARGFRLALASLVVVAVAAFYSSAARADFVTFQDGAAGSLVNGGGGLQEQINQVIANGANTLAIGGDNIAPGDLVNTYYQASIASLKNNSTTEYLVAPNELGVNFSLTAMFGVTEQVSPTSTLTTGQFQLAPTANQTVNYFAIYAQTTAATVGSASDANGTGFNSGTLILSGKITSDTSSFTDVADQSNNVNFNISGGGTASPTTGKSVGSLNVPGQPGTGGINLTITTTSVDPNWFPNVNLATQLLFVLPQGSLIDQFSVNPASNFQLGSGTNGNPGVFTPYTPALGNVDGLRSGAGGTGSDFQFQTNAQATFLTTPIPEPATFILLSLGGLPLLGVSFRQRRARKLGA